MTDTVSVPPFCWGWGQPSVPNFEKGVIRKKKWEPGVSEHVLATDICLGGACYVFCLKGLCKMKYGFEGSVFKCQSWPV